MTETGEFIAISSVPEADWRDKLIESYEREGLKIVATIPTPPLQPLLRKADKGNVYDYKSKILPWDSSEDEAAAVKYSTRMAELREEYEVVMTAYPTVRMVRENPDLTTNGHLLVMAGGKKS